MENLPVARPGQVDIKLANRLRDQKAAQLRALHWTLTDICHHLGYPNESETHYGIQQGLASVARFAQDEARALEEDGLDELERRLWSLLDEDVPMVDRGQLVKGIDGLPIPDLRFKLDVTDRIAKVKAMRAKLRGLNAPLRTGEITSDMINEAIMRLEAEVNKHTG